VIKLVRATRDGACYVCHQTIRKGEACSYDTVRKVSGHPDCIHILQRRKD
jgi:hypothetical protein